MRGERFLTKPQQYERVYSHGNSRTSGPVVMKAIPNGLEFSRYGISVSRRVGNAVTRNRIKRRLREVLRTTTLRPGWDMVFIARISAVESDFPALVKNIKSLLKRDNIIEPNESGIHTKNDREGFVKPSKLA
jgi:ribonuclease P protein component